MSSLRDSIVCYQEASRKLSRRLETDATSRSKNCCTQRLDVYNLPDAIKGFGTLLREYVQAFQLPAEVYPRELQA